MGNYFWALVMMPVFLAGGALIVGAAIAIMLWPLWLYFGVCAVTEWCSP